MPCMFCRKILMFSSSAFICLDLLFFLESKLCIKHACDNFCIVIIYGVEHGKILNLLFDTFHSTKYFSGVVIPCFFPFCVSCCSGPNAVKFIWYAMFGTSKLL
jgi:hypothetical protein